MASATAPSVLALRQMPLQQAARRCEEALLQCLSQPQLQCFEDGLSRFRLWAANIQVFVNSRASLDYRLRLNENARDMVLQLLQVLLMNIKFCLELTMDSESGGSRQSERIKSSSTNSTAGTTGPSSISNILEQVQEIISRLQRMSSAIRRASRVQRNIKIASFNIENCEDLDQHNELRYHVAWMLKHRYSNSSDEFRDLILRAILLRHKRFMYLAQGARSRTHTFSPKGLVKTEIPPGEAPFSSQILSEEPDSQNYPISDSGERSQSNAKPDEPSRSTRTATTMDKAPLHLERQASKASPKSVRSLLQDQNLAWPSPPRHLALSVNTEFECPYCFEFITKDEILDLQLWREHLKKDIEPYTCCSCSGQEDIKTFANFEDWIQHTRDLHARREWICTFEAHSRTPFHHLDGFRNHMRTAHSGSVKDSQIKMMERTNSRPMKQLFLECPFCGGLPEEFTTNEQGRKPDMLPRHIAGHLKEVSMWSLPPGCSLDNSYGTNITSEHGDSTSDEGFDRSIHASKLFTDPPPQSSIDDSFGEIIPSDTAADELEAFEWAFCRNTKFLTMEPSDDPILESFVARRLEMLRRDDYQIGIVCALHIEWAAMIAMLDQEHAPLPKDEADSNEYAFGRIGEHNVIIACPPAGSMGTTPAATVAVNMLRSFSIKFGLMVGIGGGVWSKRNDIRLGDIVVSQPTGKHGGVVQWDEGHAKEGRFERRGQLDRPPKLLLHALQSLKTKGEMEELGISTALEYMATNKPKMAKGPNKYTYPALVDRLFKASYLHTTDDNSDEKTCDKCDTEESITRKDREDLKPEIFYGNIASGNSVMKNSKQRDDIAKQEKVLCFEMEAAGLMNDFPCLVIRGIADYSDSHKNNMWQRYAAATAAAFARVFLGFVDEQKLVETPRRAPIIIPFSKSDKFVGRESHLKQLMDIFYTNNEGNNCQRAALLGLGGVGKTQIAIQLAFQLHEKSPDCSVFWVRASDNTSFERSYREIAKELRLSGWDDDKVDIKPLVKSKLSDSSAGKWLLIVDNADDRRLFQTTDATLPSLSNHLPSSLIGAFLFTTRDHKAAMMFTEDNVISVDKMETSESMELLRSTLYNQQLIQDELGAKELLERLVHLPLAIAQAVAYINKQQITVRKYLELYRNSDKPSIKQLSEPFKSQRRYPDVEDPIVTTWIISFKHIEDQDSLAADYLKFIACIQDHDIPESILPPKWHLSGRNSEVNTSPETPDLEKLKGKAPETVNSEEKLPEILEEDSTESKTPDKRQSAVDRAKDDLSEDELLKRTAALGTLKAFGFIKAPVDQDLYQMHPLVHLVIRNWLQAKGQFSTWNDIAVERLHQLMPGVEGLGEKNKWHPFYPHAVFITSSCETSAGDEKEKIDLLSKVGVYQQHLGQYNAAYTTHRQVLIWRVEFLGREHPDTLTSMHDVGLALLGEGEYSEAERILQEALELLIQVSGRDSQNTLIVMSHLAITYSHRGRYEEAKELLSQILEINKRVLGLEHPETLKSMSNLADTYYNRGRYKEAEELGSHALELSMRVLGLEHPRTLASINSLGGIYSAQGKYKEAEELQSQVLKLSKRVLGPEHPKTLISISNLALTYSNQGRYKEAEELGSQVLEIRKRVLGLEHPYTLTSISNLVGTYSRQGRYKEAEELQVQLLDRSQASLGEEHPDTLLSMHNLAVTCKHQGHSDKAIALMKECVRLREKALGANHPRTKTSRRSLEVLLRDSQTQPDNDLGEQSESKSDICDNLGEDVETEQGEDEEV